MTPQELLPLALIAGAGAFLAAMQGSGARYRTVDWTGRGARRNPGTFSPRGITLHYGVGKKDGDPADVLDQLKIAGYSYNWMIDRDGTRYKLVENTEGSVHTDNERNRSSYGIAFMYSGPRDDYNKKPGDVYAPIPGTVPDWGSAWWAPYTSDQVASAAQLVRELGADKSWYLIGHQDVNENKSDPGPTFPWADFERQSGLRRA